MGKRGMIHRIVLAAVLQWPVLAWSVQAAPPVSSSATAMPVSGTPAEAATPANQPFQMTPEAKAALKNFGWYLVRSVRLGETEREVHMVLIDPKRDNDKTVYGAAIGKICRSRPDFCRVRFWNEARLVQTTIAFSEQQFKTLRAEYILNRSGGVEELKYACSAVPDKGQCFSH